MQSELRFHSVRGLQLAYHVYGDPGGVPLLCVHGFLDHGASFRFMAEHLPGFRVVAPDMRGHGHSEWIGAGGYYHFYDYYDDVRALVRALDWTGFHLVGHSMGGSIATGLAALDSDRVRSVILLEGMGPPYSDLCDAVDRIGRWSGALRKPRLDGGPAQRRATRRTMVDVDDAARRLTTLNPRLPASRARALAASGTEAVDGGVVWRHDPLHRTSAAKPFIRDEAEALWRGIQAPVLSLMGSDSGWRPGDLQDRYRVFARVTTGTVQEAGHNIHHDQPILLARVVREWVREPGKRPTVDGLI